MNPCANHLMNEIAFLDKTTHSGICSECVTEMSTKNHELMPIHTTLLEVKDVIMNLEVNMLEILRDRTTLLNENKGKFQII